MNLTDWTLGSIIFWIGAAGFFCLAFVDWRVEIQRKRAQTELMRRSSKIDPHLLMRLK